MDACLKVCCLALTTISAAFVPFAAPAEQYPAKPIRLVVTFAPGGAADTTARVVGGGLSSALGKQVVVDNRPGAGGNIGAEIVAKALPDGYTLLLSGTAHAIAAGMHDKLSYDLSRDLVAISQLTTTPLVVTVHPSVAAKSAKELVVLAKARPGHLTFSSAGTGSGLHLAGVLFCEMAGMTMTHVPFKGGVLGLIAVMGGDVTVGFSAVTAALPHVRSGKLRAVGVTGAQRSAVIPELPTISESGLPGYEAALWYGINAPRGTPRPVISRLHVELAKLLGRAEVKDRLATADLEPIGNAPEQYDAYIRSEILKWRKVVNSAGIKPNN